MRTDQIGEGSFQSVHAAYRLRAAQRRLKELVKVEILRRIEQPVYRGEGTKSYVYAIGRAGAPLAAQRLGIGPQAVEWRPQARERNMSYMEHALAIVDYWLALRRSCTEAGVALETWVTDRILQKEPDRVEITDGDDRRTVGVVADAFYALTLVDRSASCFFEYDRGHVTLRPSRWAQKGWRHKILAYLSLAESGRLQDRYGAGVLWVKTVTKGEARLANMLDVTAKAAGSQAHHFWFTTEDQLNKNLITDPIWQVAGKPGQQFTVR